METDWEISDELVQQFYEHLSQWKRETSIYSSSSDILENSNYKSIVAMGRDIIPLLVIEAYLRPCHICFALHDIVGNIPIRREYDGMFDKIGEAWYEWSIKMGYFEKDDLHRQIDFKF